MYSQIILQSIICEMSIRTRFINKKRSYIFKLKNIELLNQINIICTYT